VLTSWGRHEAFALRGTTSRGVVALVGELDIAGESMVAELVGEAAETSPSEPVVLDLADLTFLDVGGLNAILRVREHVTRSGREFVVRHPSPAVCRLLELCHPVPGLPVEGSSAISACRTV
jgi:anti-anti-sigma factor